ncbi:MAG: hypothetical protein H6705_08570 [Myxococcales bacterium]|nr:hypothetical protein [Myxococcales bacterium]
MKTAAALFGLALLALAACDDGPSEPRPPADAAPDTVPDALPDTLPDALPDGPPDSATDADPPDTLPDATPADADPPDQGPRCPAPTARIAADAPLDPSGAWRLALDGPATPWHRAPCGDTAGAELSLEFTARAPGRHLLVADGAFTALYAAPPCDRDARLACADPDGVLYTDLDRGDVIRFVFDAPPGEDAAAVRLALYPPRGQGEPCTLLDETPAAPACAPGLACEAGRCAVATPPAITRVRALTDGQTLRLAVDATDQGHDLVEALWARVDRDDRFHQLEIIDAERTGARLHLDGFIEDPDLALADRVEIELIDAAQGSARAEIDVQPAPARAPGEDCDPLGVDDVCVAGAACVFARCRPLDLDAWIAPDGAHLLARLAELDLDIAGVTLRARLLDDDGAPLGAWSRLPPLAAVDPLLALHFGAIVPAPAPAIAAAARVVPAGRPPSLPIITALTPLPLRPADEHCDPTGLTDACADGTACIDAGDAPRCQRAEPPVIDALRATRGPHAIGVKLTYRDPNDDATAYTLQHLDAAGALRWTALDQPLPPGLGDSVQFSLITPEAPAPDDRIRLVLTDRAGLRSDVREVPLADAPLLRQGDPCDPLGGLDTCPDGTLCVPQADGALCTPPDVECPEDYRATTWELDALPFSWNDTNRNGPQRTAGLCGGDDRPELVYRVIAPRDDRWLITVDTPDTTLYVRRYCALAVPFESELACADGRVELDVQAGALYFVFVDGPGDNGGRFRVDLDRPDPAAAP